MEDGYQQHGDYVLGTAPDPADLIDDGARKTIFAIIWQAVCDLREKDDYLRWDAQRFFHNREQFDQYAIAVDLDPDAARQGLIRQGLLPPAPPPVLEHDSDDDSRA